jgi:hypothetical protein
LAPAGLAQNRVVPTHLTSVEGNDYFDFPFVYDKGRFQQIWDGSAVCGSTAVIQQVSFRRDTNYRKQNYAATTFLKTTVSLGSTPVTPAKMTTNFANNLVGAKLTTLVNGVNFSLPAQTQYPSVAPFNVHYPFSAPLIFQRSSGNLIMEWTVPGSATSKSIYTLDGEVPTKNTGYVRPFGTFGKFKSGETPTFACDPGALVPGGSIDLVVSPLKSAYLAAAFFSLSDTTYAGLTLPFDLGLIGGQGSTLYTGRTIEVPMAVTTTTQGFSARVKLPLPSNGTYSGYRLFAQTWFGDKTSNSLGVVTSNALELVAGTGSPYTHILGQSNSTAATGFFEKGSTRFGGPVVLFTGSIN